jgi:small-conductance mechanosensitive channel
LVFALLLTLSRWFTSKLNNTWLQKTRMDRGAREALVTFSRYTVIALAVLFALSLAGIEFANLAIVAGALSVGIGFGLQNVVNNFVSGLILLFERPVRTGDWIVVGNTQGTVKSINIRSTTVQTFDRAEVIVPNSELISGQVTNWTLDTPRGRICLPVGVAYGSDTTKVKEVLLETGKAHPRVVCDDSHWPKPNVLFLAFGASSLDFELRVIVRDISERAQVISDLNFAIDQAFRDNGIEIPFPQQDVYLKQVPEGLRSDMNTPPGRDKPNTDGQDK